MTVTNFKQINKGALQAAFDLELPSGLKIIGLMLMKNQQGSWCSFPGIPYEKDGKTAYNNVIEIPDRDRRDRFSAMVIEALAAGGHV